MKLLIIFLVSTVLLWVISIVIAKLKSQRIMDCPSSGILNIFAWIILIFGCIIYPIAVPINEELQELKPYEYEILQSEYSIVINMYNPFTNEVLLFPVLFNSHELNLTITDETKFYIFRKKSLVGLTLERNVVWSNPPHKIMKKH